MTTRPGSLAAVDHLDRVWPSLVPGVGVELRGEQQQIGVEPAEKAREAIAVLEQQP